MSRSGDSLRKTSISLALIAFELFVGYAFFGTNLFPASNVKNADLSGSSITGRRSASAKNGSLRSTNAKKSGSLKSKPQKADSSGSATTVPTTTTLPTTTVTTTTTSTSTSATPSSYVASNPAYAAITVRVANGTTIPGLAERITSYLGEIGFNVVSPVNATQQVASSTVYYAQGFSVSAQYIASRLGLSSTQVVQDSSSIPVNAPPEDINIVVGPDLSSAP
ncbi:LytR cell envelope-related transcriptional attenuator [Ferrithrix thermotolerans DSM 19514]|uniref:LytR cell envelope-related transcriptional attenuator n=1 Tax=Ferrithrix thermotolerans DSM 19514 TaxID=1121881 RepID=A0A1M4TJ37_9ACTN|nr:LytR C-terminal domain-containing protein [Ferrithrix thermotolerans]SHE44480.1 LytR cell envelope-related transcriptional attenuator [Ferrithrix thermotolerans DSM 19514]